MFAAGIGLLSVPAYLRTAQTTPVPIGDAKQESAVSLRVMFGVQRIHPKTWDGEMTLDRGSITGLTGVFFEHEDAVLGPGRWKCTSRATNYMDSRSPRGYDPVHTKPWELIPNGVVATAQAPAGARVDVKTASGNFSFTLDQLVLGAPLKFLDGDATVERIPTTVALTTQPGENDYPSLATDSRGDLWASWISYANRADAVFVAHRGASAWDPPARISGPEFTDNFRTALAEDGQRRIWAIWSAKGGGTWGIYGRYYSNGVWSETQRITGDDGPNLYHAVARDARGKLHLVWQGFRDRQSKILLKTFDGQSWSAETVVSSGAGDNWVPAVAADSKGAVWIGWDGYENGNFDVYVRKLGLAGKLEARRQISRSAGYDANVSLACDRSDRLWISWDTAEANWGKDWNSQHFSPRGGAGLYRTRAVRIAALDGERLLQPADIMDSIPPAYHDYFQMARLQVDGSGRIWAVGRSLTSFRTRVQNNWGANGRWEVLATSLEGDRWRPAVKLDSTAGRNDVRIAGATDSSGRLWFAWSADGRQFGKPQSQTTTVSYTRIEPPSAGAPARLAAFHEPAVEAVTVHENEPANVAAIRGYRYRVGAKNYRILRGDLHRHTDISADGIGDGSLLDFYRYAFTAGQYDYMVVTDHQYGGTEYNWWRTEKSEDAFLVAGRFWPLFGTERSLGYPNGHRNTFFAQRGNRELPIGRDEAAGKVNTGPILYPYLRKLNGLTSSHSSASDQGTDWRDNDPQLEPLVELYQGLNSSYEYENAPRADTPERRYYHHGEGWRPAGFVWNAWAKGLKLGVQASADHIATHDAYACVILDADQTRTREDILNAMRARHAYAATDNIIVDTRIGDHLMGDVFPAREIPLLKVRVEGTGPIDKIEVIKNNTFVHTVRPKAAQSTFEFRDNDIQPGESYYYVRVQQVAGQMAWSSPIWVQYSR
jgi:hypothetical protein